MEDRNFKVNLTSEESINELVTNLVSAAKGEDGRGKQVVTITPFMSGMEGAKLERMPLGVGRKGGKKKQMKDKKTTITKETRVLAKQRLNEMTNTLKSNVGNDDFVNNLINKCDVLNADDHKLGENEIALVFKKYVPLRRSTLRGSPRKKVTYYSDEDTNTSVFYSEFECVVVCSIQGNNENVKIGTTDKYVHWFLSFRLYAEVTNDNTCNMFISYGATESNDRDWEISKKKKLENVDALTLAMCVDGASECLQNCVAERCKIFKGEDYKEMITVSLRILSESSNGTVLKDASVDKTDEAITVTLCNDMGTIMFECMEETSLVKMTHAMTKDTEQYKKVYVLNPSIVVYRGKMKDFVSSFGHKDNKTEDMKTLLNFAKHVQTFMNIFEVKKDRKLQSLFGPVHNAMNANMMKTLLRDIAKLDKAN